MKKFFTQLLKSIANLFSKKPPQPVCSFCKEKGHVEDDCPTAAKYKMFGERDG
jgi:hypothetical protein